MTETRAYHPTENINHGTVQQCLHESKKESIHLIGHGFQKLQASKKNSPLIIQKNIPSVFEMKNTMGPKLLQELPHLTTLKSHAPTTNKIGKRVKKKISQKSP